MLGCILFAVIICAALASSPNKIRESEEQQFASWLAKYNKGKYATTEEHNLRFENFKASLKRIQTMNSRSNATFALNKFSDLSPAEFRAKYLMKNKLKPITGGVDVLRPTFQDAPAKFDWRPQNVLTPVKDQAQCGSCWAFSVVENIESVYMLAQNITAGQMKALAPQQLVDCDQSDEGCDGGYPTTAYDYIKSAGGLETESAYPYHAVDQTCAFKKADVFVSISSYKAATTQYDEKTMQQNLASVSPLSICVDASNWQDYESGIMSTWDCCWFCELDHCVQLVAYDTTASTPFYTVRNSWGSDWGEKGFIRVEMGNNACGITDLVTTAVI